MQYVKFGNTGMDVSRICLGMMSFGKPGKENGVFPWAKDYEDGKEMFKKAIELGINWASIILIQRTCTRWAPAKRSPGVTSKSSA